MNGSIFAPTIQGRHIFLPLHDELSYGPVVNLASCSAMHTRERDRILELRMYLTNLKESNRAPDSRIKNAMP